MNGIKARPLVPKNRLNGIKARPFVPKNRLNGIKGSSRCSQNRLMLGQRIHFPAPINRFINNRALKSLPCLFQEAVSDGCWYAQEAEDGAQINSFETLIGGAGLFALPEETSITAMRFTFTDRQVIWTVVDGGVEKEIKAALDGRFDISQVGGYSYGATARWRGVQALEMEVRRLDAISGVRMIFRFDGDEMRIEADETLMTAGGLGMYEKHLVRFVQE